VKESAVHKGFLECATHYVLWQVFPDVAKDCCAFKGPSSPTVLQFFRMLAGAIHLTKGNISEDFNLQ
jgi:hypothetical protein